MYCVRHWHTTNMAEYVSEMLKHWKKELDRVKTVLMHSNKGGNMNGLMIKDFLPNFFLFTENSKAYSNYQCLKLKINARIQYIYMLSRICFRGELLVLLISKSAFLFFLVSGWYNHVPSYNGCSPKKGNNRRILPLQASYAVTVVG